MSRRPSIAWKYGDLDFLRACVILSQSAANTSKFPRATHILMHKPVVDLELNPRSSQKIHDRRRLELISRQQLLAHDSRIRRQEFFFSWFFRMLSRYITPESHPGTAHQRLIQFIEQSIRVSRDEVALIFHGTCSLSSLSLDIRVDIVKIVFLELEAEGKEIEDADEAGEFMPGYDLVDSFENLDQDTARKGWFRHIYVVVG